MSRKLDNAIHNLGKYFGVISKDAFVTKLLAREAIASKSFFEVIGSEDSRIKPFESLARLVLDVTQGALTTDQILKRAAEIEKDAEEDAPKASDILKILYEPGTHSESSALLKTSDGLGIKPTEGEYSVKSTSDISANSLINTAEGANYDGSRTLSVIQVLSSMISPASRDTGALSLFLSSVPTLEISKCIPLIDISLIQPGANVQAVKDDKSKLTKMSLGYFLQGGKRFASNSPEAKMLNARRLDTPSSVDTSLGVSTSGMEMFTSPQTLVNADEDFVDYGVTGPDSGNNLGRAAPVIDKFRPLMSLESLDLNVTPTAGIMSHKAGSMSLVLHDRSRLAEVSAFVNPQNFGGTHLLIEYGWAHPDAMRPGNDNLYGDFINSLRCKEKYHIVNSSFSFEADGQVKIELEISMLSDSLSTNVQIGMGEEVRDKYQEIKVLTALVDRLSQDMQTAVLSNIVGEGVPIDALSDPDRALTLDPKTKNEILKQVKSMSSDKAYVDYSNIIKPIQDLLNTDTGAISAFQKTVKSEIRKRIDVIKKSPGDPFFIDVDEVDVGISKKNNTFQSTNITYEEDKEKREITDRDQLEPLTREPRRISTADYNRIFYAFTRGRPDGPFYYTPINLEKAVITKGPVNRAFVSLGKLLLTFFGTPAASSGHYDDIQLIFYNFNDKASYMRNKNIAGFPINVNEFEKELESYASSIKNIPLARFVNLIGERFISDPAARPYGFSALYEDKSEDGKKRRALKERFRKEKVKLFNEKQDILRRAYGVTSETAELQFNPPSIQVYTESVPSAGTEGAGGEGSKTILRVHIYDKKCTPYKPERDILEAVQAQNLNLIDPSQMAKNANGSPSSEDGRALNASIKKAVDLGIIEPWPPTEDSSDPSILKENQMYRVKGGVRGVKKYLMSTMPSLRYGSGNSGVLSANLSSQADSSLSTVMMQRSGDSVNTPVGAQKTGLPMTVHPTTLELETIGCPLWQRGQQIFVDFGTGTTADNIYAVNEIKHTITSGEFRTTVSLLQLSGYASYKSVVNKFNRVYAAAAGIKKENTPE